MAGVVQNLRLPLGTGVRAPEIELREIPARELLTWANGMPTKGIVSHPGGLYAVGIDWRRNKHVAYEIRSNGFGKRWKTRPRDADLKFKAGLNDAFTVAIRDGEYVDRKVYVRANQ